MLDYGFTGTDPGAPDNVWLRDTAERQVLVVRAGTGCWYDQDNERLDEGEPKRTVVVDRLYIETHAPTVREQLVKAGVRLGGLLNQALAD